MSRVTLPWVPVYGDLPTHRKSLRLEAATRVPRAWTHVVELWLWCSRHRPDGQIGDIPEHLLAELCHWPHREGLVQALREVGFLDDCGQLHGWDEYVGAYLRRRETNRSSQAARRRRTKPADVSADSQPSSAPDRTVQKSTGHDRILPGAGAPKGADANLERDQDTYVTRFKERFQAPNAELTCPARKAFARLRQRHGLTTLLKSLDGLAADAFVRTNWSLDQCCSQAGVDRGTRARAGPGVNARVASAPVGELR